MRARGGGHVAAVELGVGPGEVDELEQAQVPVHRLGRHGADAAGTVGPDGHDLARLQLAHELGAHDVERRRLRRQHPAAVEAPEAQGTEAVRVAGPDDLAVVQQHQRVRTLERGQHGGEGIDQVRPGRRHVLGQQLGHQVGVAGGGAGQHAGGVGQGLGVGEVAVVAEGELVVADVAVDGLGVAPVRRAGRAVAAVTDGVGAGQRAPACGRRTRSAPGPCPSRR